MPAILRINSAANNNFCGEAKKGPKAMLLINSSALHFCCGENLY